jgi:hypothetical protein
MVVNVTMLQLGQRAIVHNDTWITIAVARTYGLIDQVAGGWSTMLRILVEDLFLGPLGISETGFPLVLPDGATMIYANLGSILGDGDGLRLSYDWRGASSLKPCLLHYNVLRKNCDLLLYGEGFVDITCADRTAFRSWLDADVNKVVVLLRESHRRVAAGELTQAKYEEIAQACGLHWNPLGFLASDRLRTKFSLVGCLTFDWMHTLLQDGCFVIEASLIVQACSDHVINVRSAIKDFLADPAWHFPAFGRVKAKQLHRIFDHRRILADDATRLKVSATRIHLVPIRGRPAGHGIRHMELGRRGTCRGLMSSQAAENPA